MLRKKSRLYSFTSPSMIKKIVFILIMSSSVAFHGCNNDDPEYLLELTYTRNFALPIGQNPALSVVIPYENIKNTLEDRLREIGKSMDDVRIIQTAHARMDLNTIEGDLSVLSQVLVNVYKAPDPRGNSLEAAYTIEIRDRATDRLDLIPSLANLVQMFDETHFNMELVLTFHRINTSNASGIFTITFGVLE